MKVPIPNQAEKWDVIVVGAGPGGAAASKRCAEAGLRTLVLEKRVLPRDKVCSGMIMGPWAQEIIRDHFGPIPREVLVPPRVLKGHRIHVPGARPEVLEWATPLAWRKDLDAWLIQKAESAGVEVRDRVKLIGIESASRPVRIRIADQYGEKTLEAGWLIGADGANSAVRKFLFPEMKVQYSIPIRECYSGSLTLEKEYFHWFFPRGHPRPRFNVNHKGDCFLIEGSGIRELREDINRLLSEYGFDPAKPPAWKDGCLIPKLHGPLLSGSFSPARGNVLLIGDAAGLLFPITFEGIGSALKSGLLAAEAVLRAAQTGREAANDYLSRLEPVLQVIKILLTCEDNLARAAHLEPEALTSAIRDAYEKTLGTLKVKEGGRLFFISRGEEIVIKPLGETLHDLRSTVPVKGEQDFDEIRKKVRMSIIRKAAGDES